jgi:predicted amidohydrolase YtcJ
LYQELSKGGQKLSENLRIGGVKTFADGSLGSLTALFNEV